MHVSYAAMSRRVQGASHGARGGQQARAAQEARGPQEPQGAQPARGAPDTRRAPDRYEPLPGIAGLPRWLWRKLPRAGRVAVVLLPLGALAVGLALAPGIDESKDRRAAAERERQAQLTAERVQRIRAEQRPRFERGTPAGRDLAARATLVAALPVAIQADARQRVAAGALDGPIRSVDCEPYPRSADGQGAHADPSQPTGRYSCLAVTRNVEAGERNEAASIGHPYRALIHFDTGRYAFCKVSGRPGEGSIGRLPPIPVPKACGGD
jgi:hypothetical protein